MSAAGALLDLLPRTSLVVGKGGVGKTTCAAAIAQQFALRGERTLLLSTDPAAALADVLGVAVSGGRTLVPERPGLEVRQLAAAELRRDFLSQWRDTIAEIIDRGTYLDRDDVDGLVDAALPGADEIFALLALADLVSESARDSAHDYARIVVDTAPTGHTLRLLALPDTFAALVSMLDLMQEKHRFMVRALTHRYRRDRADEFLDLLRARIAGLRAALCDASLTRAVVVTRAEPIVIDETRRYLDDLRVLHVHVAAVVVNAADSPAAAAAVPLDASIPHFFVPRTPSTPRGLVALRRLADSIAPARARAPRARASPRREVRRSSADAEPASGESGLAGLVRVLTIVAGKGGVGKSTVACALAIAAADRSRDREAERVLLVSTDPAPSLADALGEGDAAWARRDVEHALPDVPRLVVRQMDATTAFARLRDTYQARIDAVFDAFVGRGVDVERDRAILRELLALAPPGIDELLALSLLGDALAERRFTRIVVDPAPTGHLLRLLDMPAIALDWAHRLMRLMLKYREVVSLGDAAEELLAFSRRTRAFDELLHDPARAAAVVVALDEPVVRAETERLVSAIAERGIDVAALVWNRVANADVPLPAARARRQFFALDISPSPVGATAIREWSRRWREQSPAT